MSAERENGTVTTRKRQSVRFVRRSKPNVARGVQDELTTHQLDAGLPLVGPIAADKGQVSFRIAIRFNTLCGSTGLSLLIKRYDRRVIRREKPVPAVMDEPKGSDITPEY